MRDLHEIDAYRDTSPEVVAFFGDTGDGGCGAFAVPFPRTGVVLRVIASDGEGWDHVSVSLAHRIPNWLEMEHIKRMFFRPDECCMQLHVAVVDHINCHPHTLHLWRPNDGREIPRPPNSLVGGR